MGEWVFSHAFGEIREILAIGLILASQIKLHDLETEQSRVWGKRHINVDLRDEPRWFGHPKIRAESDSASFASDLNSSVQRPDSQRRVTRINLVRTVAPHELSKN